MSDKLRNLQVKETSSGSVLRIDSLQAALTIDDILDELGDAVDEVSIDHDGFLFSFVATFHASPECVLPDRADMTANTHFLRSFSQRVTSACRRRGVRVSGDLAEDAEADPGPVEEADLLLVPRGRITERGMRENIRVFLADADSTAAKLAAALLWQWVRHDTGVLDTGRIVTRELFQALLDNETRDADAETLQNAAALADIVLCESFTMHGL